MIVVWCNIRSICLVICWPVPWSGWDFTFSTSLTTLFGSPLCKVYLQGWLLCCLYVSIKRFHSDLDWLLFPSQPNFTIWSSTSSIYNISSHVNIRSLPQWRTCLRISRRLISSNSQWAALMMPSHTTCTDIMLIKTKFHSYNHSNPPTVAFRTGLDT